MAACNCGIDALMLGSFMILASAFFTRKIEQIQQTGSQGFFESSKESEYTDFVDLSGEETKERKTISEWDVEKWDNKFK